MSPKASRNRVEHRWVQRGEKATAERMVTTPCYDRFERLQGGDGEEYASTNRESIIAFETKAGRGQINEIDVDTRCSGFTNQRADIHTTATGGAGFCQFFFDLHGLQERPRRRSV